MRALDARAREAVSDTSLLLTSLVWGSTFILVKQAVAQVPTFSFLTLRFSMAAGVLLLVCGRRLGRIDSALVRDGAVLGSMLFLTFAFQTLGLAGASASVAAFISGLYVVFVPIFSSVWLKKRPRPASAAGVGIAAFGLGLITLNGSMGLSVWEFFVLLCSIFCSVHIILTDHLSRRHDPLLLTTIQILVMLVLSSGLSFWLDPATIPERFSPQLVFAVLLTGVLATAAGFLVQTGMQKHTTPTKAAIIYTMEPVSALFFAWLIAGELLQMRQYVGAALIVGAMVAAETGTLLRPRSALAAAGRQPP